MNYKEIIVESWKFTQENKRFIFWYGALPSLFSTVFGICYVFYQYYAFLSSSLFENWDSSFLKITLEFLGRFLSSNQQIIFPFIIFLIIFLLGYFILPILCQAALIQLIARTMNGQPVKVRHGLKYALIGFLPLFEYKLLIRSLSYGTLLGVSASALRLMGWQSLNFLITINAVIMFAAFIVALFFTYTEFYIVIDEKKMLEAMSKSMKLVTVKLEETFFMSMLMLIIGLRILLQLLFILLIPSIFLGVLYLFTINNLPNLAIILATIIGFLLIILASYLNGAVHVFSVAVWTSTFLKFTSEGIVDARGEIKTETSES